MIFPSYDAQSPANAVNFVEWLENSKRNDVLKGVTYAFYGCGNHDWVSTFHCISKLLDAEYAKGATRIAALRLGDVASDDIFGGFYEWQDNHLRTVLDDIKDSQEDRGLEVDIDTNSRSPKLRQGVKEAVVISSILLTVPRARRAAYYAQDPYCDDLQYT